MTSPIGLPLFSNPHSFWLTQDKKGLLKACNGAECKGVPSLSSPWIRVDFFAFLDLPSLFTTPQLRLLFAIQTNHTS
ncbi:hypothetical protein H5410_005138 [Solanum commersonii]|uniref:Uncharacterized protein n=1 Tax=Solanum commersonii TaxID=4109 RepID=A0A9J6A6B7_SOLCO|nr:hypothetical protein H5410_005138 [Solanum commersonii]